MTRALLSRAADPRAEALVGAAPFISVIVPVRNEAAFIRRTLEPLLRQNYDPGRYEVLVADGRSTDATREIVAELAREHPNLRLLDNPRRWSSAGRNVAVREARGDIIVLIDGHCDVDGPNYLLELTDAFARSGADCLGRPQPLDVMGATSLQRAVAAARSSPLGHNPGSYIYSSAEAFVSPRSVAVAYWRSVFDTVGLFDESFDACEDVEFNHRLEKAGLRCFFTPRVTVRYHPRKALRGVFRQLARYGRGRVRLLRKHADTFTWACFVPAVFLVGLIGGAAVAALLPWFAVLYFAGLGTYVAALLGTSVYLAAKHRDPGMLPWLPAVFASIHAGAGYGILREAIVGQRRHEPGRRLVLEEQPR
jgi:succinoglycan biosynthesis protein ExoA